MIDWSGPFLEAEIGLRLAKSLLTDGDYIHGDSALVRTIAHLEATRRAMTDHPNCEIVRLPK